MTHSYHDQSRKPDLSAVPADYIGIPATILYIVSTNTLQVSNWLKWDSSYIVHSCFLLSFPIHLIYVLLKTKYRLRPLLTGLIFALTAQINTWNSTHSSSIGSLSMAKLVVPIICITAFYNLPGLLWFIAVPLASYDVFFVTFSSIDAFPGSRT